MRVCGIYRETDGEIRAHPVHREWIGDVSDTTGTAVAPDLSPPLGETILSDVLQQHNIPVADVYLFESPSCLYLAPFVDGKVIYLETNWRVYGDFVHNFEKHSFPKGAIRKWDRRVDRYVLRRILARYVNGILTVSEMMKHRLKLFYSGPVGVCHPYIDESLGQELMGCSPDIESRDALFVGTFRDHKGVDILTDSWAVVREVYPDATLHLVGDTQDKEISGDGVRVHGYVDSIRGVMERCAFYLHPARLDAFPVSTLEAMVAGLPTIVTTGTGTKSAVARVDPSFVVDRSVKDISDRAIEYMGRSDKQELSDEVREVGGEFVGKTGEFRDVFLSLVNTTYGAQP